MERTRLAIPHFTIRDLLWLTVVVALVLALIYTKQPSAVGRYQLVPQPSGDGRHLIDTVTGDYWWQGSGGNWYEGKSPARDARK